MRFAWSVGHDCTHKGAYSEPLMEWEHFLAKKVVSVGTQMIKDSGLDIQVFTPWPSIGSIEKSAGAALREKIQLINDWGADVALESHFNSSANPQANGCEMLYFSLPGVDRFSKNGKIFAQILQENTLFHFSTRIKDRGIKGMADLRRVYNGVETVPRYAFLIKTKMPSVIAEPLFISSPKDTKLLKMSQSEEIENIAKAVVASIVEYKNRS